MADYIKGTELLEDVLKDGTEVLVNHDPVERIDRILYEKITFLKTFIQTRWLHNFKTRAALEAYQKKQLSNYMDFLKRESPYFKNGVPTDFDHMDKTFMMAHFNELNTQGIDRDEALP